jgi:predicted metalloendopeptidase
VGNLENWWSAEDKARFTARTDCIANQYSQYEPIPGVKLNGRLTLGENTADNGGLRIAFIALSDERKGKPETKIEGFTPEQRFFLGWGQIWCENSSPEALRLRALTNPHSPGRYRVNGVVSNMPEFQKAFNCPAGAPMAPATRCRVW